jgi:hypothetical protein
MSVGHHPAGGVKKSVKELYRMLGEGDTSELYARSVRLITDRDIPYGGGTSVDGREVFIDRRLYADIMAGRVAVRGMSAKQIVQAIIEHEHTEWSVDAGDNPCDAYQPSHEFAEAKEDRFVDQLGVDPERYEAALRAPLAACLRRDPENPPTNLWCGPYVDEPDARDREILRIFRAKGVVDAHKKSKIEVHYGIGAVQCATCRHYEKVGATRSTCQGVSGIVRFDRSCDDYAQRKAT